MSAAEQASRDDTAEDAGRPGPWLRRVTGVALLLSAVLVVGSFVLLVLDDSSGAIALLILLGLITVPVLVAAGVAVAAAVTLLRGGPMEPRVVPSSALLALGSLGVVAIALQVREDGELEDAELVSAGAGGVALVAALLALGAALPGRSPALRIVAALAGGVLLLGLLVLRAVAQLD